MAYTTRSTDGGRPADPARAGPAPPRSATLSRTLGAFVTTVALSGGLACGGDKTTGPPTQTNPQTDLTCPSASVPLCTNTSGAAAARDGASDASARSAAALENATARTALTAALNQLDAALVAQNITNARAALAASRGAITAARAQAANFPGDAADLDVIELMLDYVATLIG